MWNIYSGIYAQYAVCTSFFLIFEGEVWSPNSRQVYYFHSLFYNVIFCLAFPFIDCIERITYFVWTNSVSPSLQSLLQWIVAFLLTFKHYIRRVTWKFVSSSSSQPFCFCRTTTVLLRKGVLEWTRSAHLRNKIIIPLLLSLFFCLVTLLSSFG